jgi:hypothetical protein
MIFWYQTYKKCALENARYLWMVLIKKFNKYGMSKHKSERLISQQKIEIFLECTFKLLLYFEEFVTLFQMS